MEFTGDEVVIDKPLNDLDRLTLDVVDRVESAGIEYAVVSGYVAVLFGRARATEDIDVILGNIGEESADALATELSNAGYWGPAMPLEDLYSTLSDGLPIRVAEEGHRVPNVELKLATDEYDRASIDRAITIRLPEGAIRIAPIELQIAYKLGMGAQRDFEDALYLYEVAGGALNREALESYVEDLGVREEYDELRSV